jgi:hypothetical protein
MRGIVLVTTMPTSRQTTNNGNLTPVSATVVVQVVVQTF